MSKNFNNRGPGLKLRSPKEMEDILHKRLGEDYRQQILALQQVIHAEDEDENLIREESNRLQELVSRIRTFCEQEIPDISPTQVRNIFELIQQRGTSPKKLPFLRPKLAYYAARVDRQKKEKPQLQIFAHLLDNLLQAVETQAQLNSLRQFMEAVLAYHVFVTRKS